MGKLVMSKMRLRDQREPGWFWADNELFDVFQPLIGPYGVLVYIALCRMCRSNEVIVSRRALGDAAGVSKDTVDRAMKKLVEYGMVAETLGNNRQASAFKLLNLKESGKKLRVSIGDADEANEKQTMRLSQRHKVSGKPSAKVVEKPVSGKKSASPTETRVVADRDACVSHRDALILKEEKLKLNTSTNPPPPSRGRRTKRGKDETKDGKAKALGAVRNAQLEGTVVLGRDAFQAGAQRGRSKGSRAAVVGDAFESVDLRANEQRPGVASKARQRDQQPQGSSTDGEDTAVDRQGSPTTLAEWRQAFHGVMRDVKDYLTSQEDNLGPEKRKALGFESGYDLWKRCFDDLVVSDYEADEVSHTPRLVLESNDPKSASEGLTIFKKRISKGMTKHFGQEVQLSVRHSA